MEVYQTKTNPSSNARVGLQRVTHPKTQSLHKRKKKEIPHPETQVEIRNK